MNSYTLLLMSLVFLVNAPLYSNYENPTTPEKIYIVIKNDSGIWNSDPIKLVRTVGYFGFSFFGYLRLIDAFLSPFAPYLLNKNPFLFFGKSVLASAILLGIAQALKVKKTQEKEYNNVVIINSGQLSVAEKCNG